MQCFAFLYLCVDFLLFAVDGLFGLLQFVIGVGQGGPQRLHLVFGGFFLSSQSLHIARLLFELVKL